MSHCAIRVSVVAGLALALVAFVPSRRVEAGLFNTAEVLENARIFALDSTFDPVGLFTGTNSNNETFVVGSGILIDPYWVLTAGHVTLSGPGVLWQSMEFNLSADTGANPDKFIPADLWIPYPGYDTTVPVGTGSDIALVRLSEPVFDVTPAARFYGEDVAGIHLLMAGYGNPGVWPTSGAFDGIRRAGENVGDSLGGLEGEVEEQYWLAEFDDATEQPLPIEWVGSRNDSGGPWLADVDGTMQLVGITSFVVGDFESTGAIRTSLYNGWIDTTIASASVPEPTSTALMTIGLLAWLGVRRRKRNGRSGTNVADAF